MADIVELSPALFITDRMDPHLSAASRSGGIALDGSEQIVSPLSERWMLSIVLPLFTKTHIRALRVAKSKLKGRFNYLLVRLCDPSRITRRDVGASYPGGAVPHSDGAFFSDDSGYRLAQPISPVMAAGAANAVTVTVRASDFAGAMSSGVFFSIDYWLYQVDDWELVGGNYVLQISPPLRAPVTTDSEADFSAPSLWRLESDDEGRAQLQIGKFGSVTLNLVEPVGR